MLRKSLCLILLVLLVGSQTIYAQDSSQTTYTVQAGESLFGIAQKFGVSVDDLTRLNNIVDPSTIYAGQVLVISSSPAPAEAAPVAEVLAASPQTVPSAPIVLDAPAVVSAQPATPTTLTHIVQANEGLGGIAKQYGVSMSTIAQLNGISDANLIYPGQELIIDGATLLPPADYGQPPADSTGKMILVELSLQRISAYQDGELLRQVIVSTGLPGTPTVQGDYAIYSKLPDQLMTGPGYYLPGVPWVMYFYQGYAIHGTYWHSNFGQPMSHGCVNLPTEEALWFYEFAPVGTLVRVVA